MSFFKEVNYTNQGNKNNNKEFKPFYAIKDDQENIYRIAPPCRNLPQGEYAVFRKIHFGYGVLDPNNPDKFRHRPFECIKKTNYKTKLVDIVCPECDNIDVAKRQREEQYNELVNAKQPRDHINAVLKPQDEWLRQHNLDSKWYCYAKNLSGEWNVLKIGHKVKMALDDLMKRLASEDGIKSLDPASGVWFRFKKNGLKGSQALTTVEVLREKAEMNGQKVEIIKSAPLTEADVASIEALPDITNNTVKITYEQINALVESGGSPEIAATVFAMSERREGSPTPRQTQQNDAARTGPVSVPVNTVKAEPAPRPTIPAPAVADTLSSSPEEFLRKFAPK